MQPTQQHGRRIPSLSSETTRFTCSSLVFCCLTVIVQQIHSLRASGVRLCHIARAPGAATRAFFRSAGNLCTLPPASCSSAIHSSYSMQGRASVLMCICELAHILPTGGRNDAPGRLRYQRLHDNTSPMYPDTDNRHTIRSKPHLEYRHGDPCTLSRPLIANRLIVDTACADRSDQFCGCQRLLSIDDLNVFAGFFGQATRVRGTQCDPARQLRVA